MATTTDHQMIYEYAGERAKQGRSMPLLLIVLAAVASALTAVSGVVFGYMMVAGIALVGLVLVLAFVRTEFATQAVIFVLYSNLSVIAIYRGVPSEIAGSFFLLLGVPLLNYLFVKHENVVISPVLIMIVGYIGVLVLSAAFAERPSSSYGRIISFILEGLVLYFLVINTVRTEALLRKVIWMFLAAGIAMGSVTLYQGLTGAYDNEFGGWAQVSESETSIGEEDFLGNQPTAPRVAGPIGEKNRFAQVMVVLLPLAIGRIWAEQDIKLKALAVASIAPIVGGALLTFSRGAGIGLAVTLVALVFVRMLPLRYVLVMAVVVVVVAVGLVPGYFYRISNLDIRGIVGGNVSEADTSVQGRMTQYITATHMIRANPLLGVGPGQASRYITDYARGIGFRVLDDGRRIHNFYLEEMVDTGLLGFGLLMGIVGVTLGQLAYLRVRYRMTRPDIVYTASSLMLSIITYLSTAMFLHLAYMRYFWVLLALAGAAIAVWTALLEVPPPRRTLLARAESEPAQPTA